MPWDRFKNKNERNPFDDHIARILDDMCSGDTDSKEYKSNLAAYERLYKLREENKPQKVKPDTWVTVGGYLIGILIFAAYEQRHAFTTKGLSLLLKPKTTP